MPGTIIEKVPSANGTSLFYNTAFFISNDGSVLGSYRKKNIWHPERPHLTSSGLERHAAIDTPVGRVGMLICWDLAFPEAFRELIADGAEIVIIPTFCESLISRGGLHLYNLKAETSRDTERRIARMPYI